MIIHSGGTSRKGGQSEPGSNRLFHIRQSSSGATRAVEVEALASNLNTNDVFVLKSPKGLFVWRGVGASEEEMKAAKHVVHFLGGSPNNVSEGKEPGWSQTHSWHKRLVTTDFWSTLGGKKEYQTSKSLQGTDRPPRLFDPSGRKGLPITTIKQGAEPPTFTGWFQAWDPKMWEKDPLERIRAGF
ncbi:hypothetical protein GOODEAATRI_006818 [Goodea atripinnis]|uniref:Gelsolin-like domain-containing protein n=1 Tax=Goodea atripinnis TaxID=208336 RepID=A0ABV0MPX1_9TELE